MALLEEEAFAHLKDETARIAQEAYLYCYPLVLMETTRRQMTNAGPDHKPGYGPMNAFSHFRAYPPADFREVVRPNFDTLYSIAWFDVETEPLVLSVPDTAGRYYLLQMLDMYTEVFAAPGKRTSGTGAMNFVIVGPGFTGALPELADMHPGSWLTRIQAPTPRGWIIGRTQTEGSQDFEAVHKIQDGYRLAPLSSWGKALHDAPSVVVADPSVDMKTEPMIQVQNMGAEEFFDTAARLMAKHPPHYCDGSALLRFRRLGFVPGLGFSFQALDPAAQAAMKKATENSHPLMKSLVPKLAQARNGWMVNIETMGVYGASYAKRACIALIGLGANQQQDAVYPLCVADAGGECPRGEHNYRLHFEGGAMPPVDAFWSLSVYDEGGFPVASALGRRSLCLPGDAPAFNSDGSLDLYVQAANPGKDRESNWLQGLPEGKISLTMRLYAPRLAVLVGDWAPPPVTRVA